jgi:hypothetical protein
MMVSASLVQNYSSALQRLGAYQEDKENKPAISTWLVLWDDDPKKTTPKFGSFRILAGSECASIHQALGTSKFPQTARYGSNLPTQNSWPHGRPLCTT